MPVIAICNFRNSRFHVAKRKTKTTVIIHSRKKNGLGVVAHTCDPSQHFGRLKKGGHKVRSLRPA